MATAMFRRSILELSCRPTIRRIPRRWITHDQRAPLYHCPRKEFSTSTGQNGMPESSEPGEPAEANGGFPKVLVGVGVAAGAATFAYKLGYLDRFIGKEKPVKVGYDDGPMKDTQNLEEESNKIIQDVEQVAQTQTDVPGDQVQEKVDAHVELPHVETEQKVETQTDVPHVLSEPKVGQMQADGHQHEPLSETDGQTQSNAEEIPKVTTEDGRTAIQEKHEVEISPSTNSESGIDMESAESKTTGGQHEVTQSTQVETHAKAPTVENETKMVSPEHITVDAKSETVIHEGNEAASLLETYHLREKDEGSALRESLEEQDLVSTMEKLNGACITKDGKLVMDFLQAIHAAEKRQAELDARAFAEERRALKAKYEKELRDLRARELMRAEEAAMLEKEIKRERAKAAAAIRAIQGKMEVELKNELERKENEAETKVKKLQDLAKAELAAAIASEKASQIEKMAEANVNINALCMAFYARSEEARQIHSVHKLALGALALEEALSKGLPIQQELDALNPYIESIDKDSLLHLVLSTLPEETRHHGTDTLLQLNEKFNALKGTLRHYILIPPGGGGLLAHSMAQVASWLRIKEVDPSGDGIESVIRRVEGLLAEGKLAEAADALQEGVRGSQAEEIAINWVKRAKNRAVTEQALSVLQSYAACLSLTQ